MSGPIREHIRSNIVGYLALYVALGGVAWAAGQIGASDIKDNAIRSNHIKNGQVKSADLSAGAVNASKVADNSLGGEQIDESSLGQVPSAANASQLGGQAPAAFQQRVTGTCSESQSVQSIAANGTVGCGAAAGSGTVTSVASGTGLAGGPITSTGTLSVASPYRLPQSCTNNQVAKSNGAGVWNCANDVDTNTTYAAAANGGLALNAGAFGLAPCTTGQILKATGATTWGCAADNSGGAPSGNAGGDLTGTYPAPTIAANAVNSAKVADNSLTGADINEGTLTGTATASFSTHDPDDFDLPQSTVTQVITLTDSASGASGGLLTVPSNARVVVSGSLSFFVNNSGVSCITKIAPAGGYYVPISEYGYATSPGPAMLQVPITAGTDVPAGTYNVQAACFKDATGTVTFRSGDLTATAIAR